MNEEKLCVNTRTITDTTPFVFQPLSVFTFHRDYSRKTNNAALLFIRTYDRIEEIQEQELSGRNKNSSELVS